MLRDEIHKKKKKRKNIPSRLITRLDILDERASSPLYLRVARRAFALIAMMGEMRRGVEESGEGSG